ncbi:hypothetical protein COX73_02985 [bacterium (Candidatus Gribaldobacteria) CG_4_10_14_0_2_um_filter_36_18]|uniref:Uncharacterized protein n=1 Tax=bacterium (Candidatus Gribaldobacteria) CG_4_10_14_0_2_um_filter_36_18 TaxID=2014264 RepID=A0A2M7VK30_9BACT|nr:MAG: hypothetical protein COX73_02985 [bacterium (Candidatus Gribaldobacteria) CG_4_10_14_0_2_um_filter_36_18]
MKEKINKDKGLLRKYILPTSGFFPSILISIPIIFITILIGLLIAEATNFYAGALVAIPAYWVIKYFHKKFAKT